LKNALDTLLAEAREQLLRVIERGIPIGGNYTGESLMRYENALRAAEEVYDNENASVMDIIEQIDPLKEASKLELVSISDEAKRTLWSVIEQSQIVVGDREEYTPESWYVYRDAYSDGIATYHYGQSDSEYYLAARRLQSAMDSLVLLSSSPDEVYVILGDVDEDSKVTIKDATFIQKCVAGLSSLENSGEISADANCDGVVNIKDATEIQKHLAGLKAQENIGKEIPLILH